MKFILGILALFVMLLAAGFVYLAFADIPVEQKIVTKEIPHERFQ